MERSIYIPQCGDIIITNFEPQSGYEQGGRRPALIISNNYFNRHSRLTIVCPITRTNKNHPFHIPLDNKTTTQGVVLCEQVRAHDLSSRTAIFIETAPDYILNKVRTITAGFIA